MTTTTTEARTGPGSALRGVARDPVALWCAFALVHLWLALYNIAGPGYPINDVAGVYKWWVDQAIGEGYRVGIDTPFVYPILALVPMLASGVLYPLAPVVPGLDALAGSSMLFVVTWLILVTVLDAVALAALTRGRGRHVSLGAAWWWVLFLALLGPIALARIDSVTVPIAIVAVTYIAASPRVAALLLTIAAWMKVWPGALVIALVVVSRERTRILTTAVVTSAVIVAVALFLGSGLTVFSFVTEQTGRGLQVEAPVSTAWLWRAWAGVPDAAVYYDQGILTWQVRGDGVELASAVMNPILLLVVALVAGLAVVLLRRGAVGSAILPPLALGLVAGLIAFQKVGSPQFISWLAVPVVLGILTRSAGAGRSFRAPAVLVLVIGALTQMIYPMFYGRLLGLEFGMLVVLSLRNVLLIALLVLAVVELLRAARWRPDGSTSSAHSLHPSTPAHLSTSLHPTTSLHPSASFHPSTSPHPSTSLQED